MEVVRIGGEDAGWDQPDGHLVAPVEGFAEPTESLPERPEFPLVLDTLGLLSSKRAAVRFSSILRLNRCVEASSMVSFHRAWRWANTAILEL